MLFKKKIEIFLSFNLFYIIFYASKIKTNIKVKFKTLLCVIAKEENRYIREFIDYYRKMKINKIILYDNNDLDGEKFDLIINKEIEDKYVKIINYRGYTRPQKKAYNNCYKSNKYKFEWIAFYDVDEYLYISNFTDINEFLSLNKFNKCKSILINWKYYGDNGHIFFEPLPIQKRFTKPFYFKNRKECKNIYYYVAAKTIVRGGLKLTWNHFPHYLDKIINCRPDGTIINNYFSEPQYSIAFIKHYVTKSTEEFIEKIQRGDVFLRVNQNYLIERIKNYYFLFNNITKNKIELFEKKLQFRVESY